jgi:hypothetical protein
MIYLHEGRISEAHVSTPNIFRYKFNTYDDPAPDDDPLEVETCASDMRPSCKQVVCILFLNFCVDWNMKHIYVHDATRCST